MNNIPVEIALAIVRNVDKKDLCALTLVNRQFSILTNPLLWRSVEIMDIHKLLQFTRSMMFNNLVVQFELSQHVSLQHLRCLTISTTLTDDFLTEIISQLPHVLEDFSISSEKHISDASLIDLPRQCPHLTTLTIGFASITDQFFVLLSEHCYQLGRLYLDECNDMSANLFAALAACPLEVISINGGPRICDDESAQKLVKGLVEFSLLKDLYLAQVDEEVGYRLLNTMDRNGNSPWPHLTSFQIQGSRGMEDQDAIRFIKSHPHITVLEFSASNFSDDVLQVIADTLPHLTFLDLSGGWDLTHHGVREIIDKCPLLTEFILDCTHLKRAEFPELGPRWTDAQMAKFNHKLEILTELGDLDGTDMEIIRRRVPDHNSNNSNNTIVNTE